MFSIVTANFNKVEYIREAISSVIKQTNNDWELLIVDDASTDDSVEVINKFLPDKRIKFLKNIKNHGYIHSLKKGIKESKGEVIVILDSDDALDENALKEIDAAYRDNSDSGMVYAQCYYCNRDLEPVHLGFSGKITKSNLHENKINALRTFKKEDYNKTEGFDKNILYAEDIDLNLKLEEVTGLYFLNKPLYYYRVLDRSQTHSFINTRINRSSTALAKLNAYKRRINTQIPNLTRVEASEVLFFGLINALLAGRIKLFMKFKLNLLIIYPIFFIDPFFYFLIYKKTRKIKYLKKAKPLLGI